MGTCAHQRRYYSSAVYRVCPETGGAGSAVPSGLRVTLLASIPALKRLANNLCAYGEGMLAAWSVSMQVP